MGPPQPQIAAHLDFKVVGLPGPVDRQDDEVLDILAAQPGHGIAYVLGLIGGRGVFDGTGDGVAPRRAIRRPAELGDDDVLGRISLAQHGDAALQVFERRLVRYFVTVRQDMDGEIIDLLHQFGIVEPDFPGLGRADRDLDVALDVADLADELRRAGADRIAYILLIVPAQDVFVSDHNALEVGILVVPPYHPLALLL